MDNFKVIDEVAVMNRLVPAVQRAAKEIGEKINEAYKTSIKQFYTSYIPSMYSRTSSLYKAARGVGGNNKYWLQTDYAIFKHGAIKYRCGIKVSSEFMPSDVYYKTDEDGKPKEHGWPNSMLTTEYIFDRSFNKGIHGFTHYNIRPKREVGKTYASKYYEGRTFVHKQSKIKVPPKVTPPRKTMSEEFQKINNKAYVDSVLKKYVKPVLDSLL